MTGLCPVADYGGGASAARVPPLPINISIVPFEILKFSIGAPPWFDCWIRHWCPPVGL